MGVTLAGTVDRAPGPRLPLGEPRGHTFAVGSAANVELACSIAIQGLLDVMRLRYTLTEERAHLLLGTHLCAAPTKGAARKLITAGFGSGASASAAAA